MTAAPKPPVESRKPDFIGWVGSGDLTYWRSHPDVIDVVAIAGRLRSGNEGYYLSFWLRPAPEGSPVDPELTCWVRPSRDPDFEMYWEVDPDHVFFGRLPSLDYFEYFVEPLGDPEFWPNGWSLARLWIGR